MKWKNLGSDTSTFFITATVTEWQPLFLNEEPRSLLLSDFEFYRRKYGILILAYVIMPEHYHMIVSLRDPSDLTGWLRDVQGHSAMLLSRWLREKAHPKHLTVYTKHADKESKLAVWKEQARAIGLLSDTVLREKVEYLHANPVRRGLVQEPGDWPWSSWRNYYHSDDSVFGTFSLTLPKARVCSFHIASLDGPRLSYEL